MLNSQNDFNELVGNEVGSVRVTTASISQEPPLGNAQSLPTVFPPLPLSLHQGARGGVGSRRRLPRNPNAAPSVGCVGEQSSKRKECADAGGAWSELFPRGKRGGMEGSTSPVIQRWMA